MGHQQQGFQLRLDDSGKTSSFEVTKFKYEFEIPKVADIDIGA